MKPGPPSYQAYQRRRVEHRGRGAGLAPAEQEGVAGAEHGQAHGDATAPLGGIKRDHGAPQAQHHNMRRQAQMPHSASEGQVHGDHVHKARRGYSFGFRRGVDHHPDGNDSTVGSPERSSHHAREHSKRQPVEPLARAAAMARRASVKALRQLGLDWQSSSLAMWLRRSQGEEKRVVPLGGHAGPGVPAGDAAGAAGVEGAKAQYPGNAVTTAKYSLLTFLPIFLFEVFSRVAYLYFLLQAALSWWREVSPFAPYGGTAALLFVVVVSGIRAAVEDWGRHVQDAAANATRTQRVCRATGEVCGATWRELRVGELVVVRDGEGVPADLVLLAVGRPEGVAFVRTVNLDGETNLKPRRPALPQGMLAAASGNDEAQQGNRPAAGDDGPEAQPSGRQGGGQLCPAPGTCSSPHDAALQAAIKGLLQLEGVIECEAPNANMHKFHGSINVQPAGTSTATDTEDTDAPASAPGDMPAPAPLAAGVQGVQAQAPAARPVTMGEVLLRGSELRNSIWAVGLVVYAGPDTRVQLNAARPPLKAGSLDRALNAHIAALIVFQLVLSVITGVAGYVWRGRQGDPTLRPHLALGVASQGNWLSPAAFIPLASLTAWILYSYLVPISLFVTMEIVKYMQAVLSINRDPRMAAPDPAAPALSARSSRSAPGDDRQARIKHAHKTGGLDTGQQPGAATGPSVASAAASAPALQWVESGAAAGEESLEEEEEEEVPLQHAIARNSGLNEDLGRVAYVFCDKTGTLTQNDMRLRQLSVRGTVYGQPPGVWRLEEHVEELGRGRPLLAHWAPDLVTTCDAAAAAGVWDMLMRHGGSLSGAWAREGGRAQGRRSEDGGGSAAMAAPFLDLIICILTCNSVILEEPEQAPGHGQKPDQDPAAHAHDQGTDGHRHAGKDRHGAAHGGFDGPLKRGVAKWLGAARTPQQHQQQGPAQQSGGSQPQGASSSSSPEDVALTGDRGPGHGDDLWLPPPPIAEENRAGRQGVETAGNPMPGVVAGPTAAPRSVAGEGDEGGASDLQAQGTEKAAEPAPLPSYQGQSPDEVALLEGARQLGFVLVGRSMGKGKGNNGHENGDGAGGGAGSGGAAEKPTARRALFQGGNSPGPAQPGPGDTGNEGWGSAGARSTVSDLTTPMEGMHYNDGSSGSSSDSDEVQQPPRGLFDADAGSISHGSAGGGPAGNKGPENQGHGNGGGSGSGDVMHLSLLGTTLDVRLLNVIEFSSERKRMSVVVAAPGGEVIAFSKGADAAMLPLVEHSTPKDVMDATLNDLSHFSSQGLRTLVLAGRVLPRDWYESWDTRYQAAASRLDEPSAQPAAGNSSSNSRAGGAPGQQGQRGAGVAAAPAGLSREEQVSQIVGDLETDMVLLGVTAIEDRLQEGVPHAVATLLAAGARVWMITGDKLETAVNIALSASLFSTGASSGSGHGAGVPAAAPGGAESVGGRDTGGEGQQEDDPSGGVGAGGGAASEGQGHEDHGPIPGLMTLAAEDKDTVRAELSKLLAHTGAGGGADMSGSGGADAARFQLVVDGRSLLAILPDHRQTARLARLCTRCAAVLVCRASPSQKARMVRMMRTQLMKEHAGEDDSDEDGGENDGGEESPGPLQAAGRASSLRRARGQGRVEACMKALGRAWHTLIHMVHGGKPRPVLLAIGDGANDVAMLRAADVGVGLLGREGRQAATAADYVLPAFRHLLPLLLVHGALSRHRLARLVSYSFYKNIAFWAVLFCYQPYCGWSGQTIVDDISAAAYNVVFTALPILLFALLDRHAPDDMLLAQPQLYATRAQPESHSTALSDHRDSYQQSAQAAASSNQKDSKKKVEAATAAAQRHAQDLHGPVLPAGVFWRSAVVLGLAHGAAAFFVPFYGAVPGKGRRGLELWGVGKAVYMALLTAVTLECGATTRYWTPLFAVVLVLSWGLALPFLAVVPAAQASSGYWEPSFLAITPVPLLASPYFWGSLVAVSALTLGPRIAHTTLVWAVAPDPAQAQLQAQAAEARRQHHKSAKGVHKRGDAV